MSERNPPSEGQGTTPARPAPASPATPAAPAQAAKPARRKTRVPCPEQDPKERVRNFSDVVLGYTDALAKEEAERCLKCKKPQCVEGCPVRVNIPAFIGAVQTGDLIESYRVLAEANPLPAVCGRVCPQETQCEAKCVLSKTGQPISIGKLERYVGDWAVRSGACVRGRANGAGRPKRVAVVGSGPAGIACAQALALSGVEVEMFEALHTLGGVLKYGIPAFRLPKDIIDVEIGKLGKLGVKFHTNVLVGRTVTVPDLLARGFDAVFIGTGAGLPKFMDVKGEELNGVMSANEFLTRVNLMNPPTGKENDTPTGAGRRVAVVGGGNVAMDCVRVARRLDVDEAMIVYRRTREEAPARVEEVHHAEQEGIPFHWLTAPLEVIGKDGWVTGLRVQRMELGEPGPDGRRKPVPVPGSERVIDVDTVIVAIGTGPNPIIGQTTPGLRLDRRGYIEADAATQATSLPGVYSGGDIVTGSATVILALGAGKAAAKAMRAYLGIEGEPEAVCTLDG